jgi:hypothetical protein
MAWIKPLNHSVCEKYFDLLGRKTSIPTTWAHVSSDLGLQFCPLLGSVQLRCISLAFVSCLAFASFTPRLWLSAASER